MEEAEKLKEENQRLQKQLMVLRDLHNIKNEPYFREQLVINLERIAEALGKNEQNNP